ncbi:MAG TPA: PqqD family peptide modification chaperone [Alphaproteobacteria bacterium]|nr:PqqD family peptide modification chaperone [Alphaproteobacteria bacterium]
MDMKRNRLLPRARREGLVVEALPDEILVYDLERHQAHCLNPTAALIWKHCDGQTSVAEMVRIVAEEMKSAVPDEVVWLALHQLHKAYLLVDRVEQPGSGARLSRREMMRGLGRTAAVALPIVTSIVAPTASQAATCLPSGSLCTSSAQCCSALCFMGVCT